MKNRNLQILAFTLVVVMLGFGIIIPILPFYVEHFGGGGVAMGSLMSAFSVAQFIFSPIWGSLSDRYGRKPILMVGVIGNAISHILFALSSELWMLTASRALGGILSAATLPTAMAYISDSTSVKERGGGMGIVGAAFGIGMVLGPGIGGMMAGMSLQAPFYFAAALSLVSLFLVWILLPESLPAEQRTTGSVRIQGPQLGEMFRALSGPIGFLLILAFLNNFALTNFEGIYGFYAQKRYNYDEKTVGLILTVAGLVSTIVQGGLTGILSKRFGDSLVIKTSLFASIFGFALMILPESLPMVLSTAGFFVLTNALLRPGVASLISKRTDIGQGAAMGLNNSFMSLGRIIGPLWAGTVLDINLNYPFLTGAVIMLVAYLTSLKFLPSEAAEEIQPVSAD
jgi:DHA1 family multidrug resistance protein-like MFS transporter